jgi:hypothetical protein
MSDEEEWVPGSKHELMAVITREWSRLMDVVSELEDAGKMTTPDEGGWSPKDNLAHIAEWMNVMMGYHIDRRPPHEVLGVSEDVVKDWDVEVVNEIMFERNKDRATEDVLTGLKQTYAAMIKKLDTMPFEDLLVPRHANDPGKRPLLMWVIGDTSDHFAEHRATIEKML